jgi:TRAP transporter 4TM/12TM fusion protein
VFKIVVTITCLAVSSFTLYTAIFGQLTPVLQRSIHIGLILILTFLLYPITKKTKASRIIDYLMILSVITATIYLYFSYATLMQRIGFENLWDTIFGTLFIVLVLEACRRVVGWSLTLIAGLFLAYGLWGFVVPGYFGHEGYDLSRLATTMYLTTEGVFGSALGAAATFVAMFIVFGTFLEKSGGSQVFIDLAVSIGGRRRGGPAKVAVFASALTGTINGSPVANVTTTGTFTIPLMKKVGYSPQVAGAVEAVASTGGFILPPIMGAGAFVMSEMTGIAYSEIAIAATIPAFLYYLSIYFVVDFEAAKKNLRGMSKDEVPDFKETFKKGILLLTPLFVLIFFLVFVKVSIIRSALYAILAVLVVSFFNRDREHRISFKRFFEILETSAKRMILVSVACATAGLVVGIITLSGLGLKLSGVLLEVGESSLFLTLILTMIGAIIVGMGLPPTPAYIVFSVLATPALVKLGVPLLAAHLFVFYYAAFAPVTPPVCLAAFTAAGISGSHPLKTGVTAFLFALPAFIIPFLFVYGPEMMAQGTAFEIMWSVITGSIGIIAFSGCSVGWLLKKLVIYQRILLLIGGLTLVIPGLLTDAIGAGIIMVTLLLIKFSNPPMISQREEQSVKSS